MPGTTKHFKDICFSQLKAVQQLSYLLHTGTEAQPLPTCLHLFVSELTNSVEPYPMVCMSMCKLRRCVLFFICKNPFCKEVNK